LNVLKPPGMTSAQVVGFARRLLNGAKVGHAGTLDPEAAGVLPLMVGKAARLFDYLQDKEKAYIAEVAFGCATDTQDAQGAPAERSDHLPAEAAIREALLTFIGAIWQQPPMFSAIKQEGKRLYELARQGRQADVPARQVTVHALALTRITQPGGALLSLRCSKGFYVRTLCHDLGQALGCPAHMRFLLRTQSGVFTLDTAQTLENLADAARSDRLRTLLIPPEAALPHLPQAPVPPGLESAFRNGGTLPWSAFPALHQTPAATGGPAAFLLNGKLAAIGSRQGNEIKLRTWLGD
jgi:tRNA pseudouridine55 synthase